MTQRTLHEAKLLLESNLEAVDSSLKQHRPIDAVAWASLCDCRSMYRELLETDEGGLSSAVVSLGHVDSLCSLLQAKGLVPGSDSGMMASEDTTIPG
jgi:hypothetical protein